MNHTKAPWKSNGKGEIRSGEYSDHDGAVIVATKVAEHNRPLICAAHDMLETLKALKSNWTIFISDADMRRMFVERIDLAIKKAEGEI